MENDDWKARLERAIKENGASKRKVSLDAGRGPGYVHSILSEGKDPSVQHLMEVCKVLGISLQYVLFGYQITPETERLLGIFENRPETRDGILKLLDSQDLPR